MKKKVAETETKKPELIPVIIKGDEYYTWPQAQEVTGWNRDELRREMKKMDIKPFAIEPYYLFVKVKDCYKLREGVTKATAMDTLVKKLSAEKLEKLATLVDSKSPDLDQLIKILESDKTVSKK